MSPIYHTNFKYRYGFDPVFRLASEKEPDPLRRVLVELVQGIDPNIPFVGQNYEQQTNLEEYLSKPDTLFKDASDEVVALVDMENRASAVNSFNRLFLYACQAVMANFEVDRRLPHSRRFEQVPRVVALMLCYNDPVGLGWPVYHWSLRSEDERLVGLLPDAVREEFLFSKMEVVLVNCQAVAKAADSFPATSALARLIVNDEVADESIRSLAERCLEVQRTPFYKELVEMISEYIIPLEEQIEAAQAQAHAFKQFGQLIKLLLADGRVAEATNLDATSPVYPQLLEEYGLV